MNLIFGYNNSAEMYSNNDYEIDYEIDFNKLNIQPLIDLYGSGAVNEALFHKTSYIENDELVTRTDLYLGDGKSARIENSLSRFKLINCEIFLNSKKIYKGSAKKFNLNIPTPGNYVLSIFAYSEKDELLGNFNISINVIAQKKKIDLVFNDINNVLEFEEFKLVLAVGSTPSTLVVKEIITKKPENIYEIQVKHPKEGYKILGIGTELKFNEDSIDGDVKIEDNKLFYFKVVTVFTKEQNENSLGKIRMDSIKDNLTILDKKYYAIKAIDISGNSVSIKNFDKNKMLATKFFNGGPLFHYFVVNGRIEKDISVLNENGVEQNIVIDIKDDLTRFVYFTAEDNRSYFYKKNNFIVPVRYKPVLESFKEVYSINDGEVTFDTPKYIDKLLLIGDGSATDITIQTDSDKIITYKNVKKSVSAYNDSYLGLTSKHHSIKKKIKKITFSNKNIKNMYNIFTDYTFSNGDLNYFKENNELVFYAKKAMEKNVDSLLNKNIEVDKIYAIEDGELVEYLDGYIELKSFFLDYHYIDSLELKREMAYTKIYALNCELENETQKELFEAYKKQFKSVGLATNIVEVKR